MPGAASLDQRVVLKLNRAPQSSRLSGGVLIQNGKGPLALVNSR